MADAVLKETDTPVSDADLSPLHAMVASVRRDFHPGGINRVVNHPDVHRWVKGYELGRLDLTSAVADPNNILLMGEHGGLLFVCHMPGLYEVHTSILPEGRGAWAKAMAQACLHIMFTRHDAMEIMTRVPRGNLGARVLTNMMGFTKEFTRSAAMGGWVVDGDPVPADIFSLGVQRWMQSAPGLIERGHWFHDKLEAEYARHRKTEPPHPEDEVHDRYVGAALEMAFAGQIFKSATLYARFALMAGYEPFQIVSSSPLTIDIGPAMLCIRNNDFWVISCR